MVKNGDRALTKISYLGFRSVTSEFDRNLRPRKTSLNFPSYGESYR